jgi:predicted CXXCH cytochrome family protein
MRIGGRVMKKRLLFLGVGSALIFTMGGVGPAVADNGPHVSSAVGVPTVGVQVGGDRCASCHRVHTAQGAFLLTTGQEGMCFTCHGTTGTGASTDVVDGVGYSSAARTGAPGALRGGGFDYALIDSANPTKEVYLSGTNLRGRNQVIPVLAAGAAVTSTHSIDTPGTAWGNGPISDTPNAGAAITLECGSCHDPHGNGNYRILRPIPVDSGYTPYELFPAVPAVIADPSAVPPVVGVPAVPAVMSAAGGIKIPDQPVKGYTTTNYWNTSAPGVPATVNGVPAVSPDGFIANVSDWCSTCHTRYKAKNGAYQVDSGDATFKYRHSTSRIDKIGSANCITCHVAHGSNANMNGASSSVVPQPDGTTAEAHVVASVPQAGSRLLRVDNRGTCVMCHNV